MKGMQKKVKDYSKILLGSLAIAVGLYFFWAPSQLAAGGVSGLAIVIKELMPAIPIGIIIMGLDIMMFTVGFIVLGKDFGIKSIVSSFAISLDMMLLEQILPGVSPLSEDNLIILLLGAIFIALGQAVIFNQEASSGGTDIIAKIISKFTHMNIGISLIAADLTVVILAVGVFGIEKGLYAALGVIINSTLIDYFISGLTVAKYVMIIPSNEKIAQAIHVFILNQLERGATTYTAEGAYSKEAKVVITTVLDRRQFVLIKQYIQSIDPLAFVTVQNLHEVVGEGFK